MIDVNVSATITIEIQIKSQKDFETIKEVAKALQSSTIDANLDKIPDAQKIVNSLGNSIQQFVNNQ